ncbi:hypothetical protein CDD81_5604 [Ophiocordyceps australis]|uniref:Nucleoporin POM33 n=1 Tax=Ophiocordyceps australis TaxID=1399860 RepID=A0A2C5Y7L4_9HYPO|nr:hypothetical protein CDD81_5604 [Ophiocordyceps australis]
MAPPPNASLGLQERLLALAKTLQFAWFVGHLTLITSTIIYAFSWIRMNYYSRSGQTSYRTAFLAAAVTYGIVVFKTQRARAKTNTKLPGGVFGLFADENIQYLVMALVWLFFPQYALALLPYFVYSVFHVATYTRTNLIPIFQPAPAADGSAATQPKPYSGLADTLGNFVKRHYESSMAVVSALEMALWFRVLLSAICLQRRSWILLALYTAFLRARYSQSTHVQNSVAQLNTRMESLVNAQGTPPVAKQVWEAVKGGLKQFHDGTDFGKFVHKDGAVKKSS